MEHWTVLMYDDDGNVICEFDAKSSKAYAYDAFYMFTEKFRHVIMYFNGNQVLDYHYKEKAI